MDVSGFFMDLQKRPKQGHKVAQMAITRVFNLKDVGFFRDQKCDQYGELKRYQTALVE